MNESHEQGAPPTARVSSSRRLSAVWIAPVLAAIAVGYMLYDGVKNRGPLVTLIFEDAEGIVAGKTPLKYEGVEIGTVEDLEVSAATGEVTIHARLDSAANDFASSGSQFWIQTPQIGLGGISQLDTLISGPYIACLPGHGARTLEFQGLPERPQVPDSKPGLRLVVHAPTIGSLHTGSPVMFRGVEVGEVDRILIPSASEPARVELFIHDEHQHLVQPNSYFWEMSGLHASFKLDEGLRIDSRSIQSILDGGVAFHSPTGGDASTAVKNGAEFILHRHPEIDIHNSTPITITFADGSRIDPGQTTIQHEGVEIGVVTAIEFADSFDGVRVSALLNPAGKRFAVEGSSFWVARPEIGIGGVRGLDTLINGVRIDSLPGNGAAASNFTGLAQRPGGNLDGPGLLVELQAAAAGSLRIGAPVYYREVVVGEVLDVHLASDASHVAVRAHIEPEFAHMVRTGTRFWNASGVKIHGGLGGIDVKSESLESIIAGGVAFATPNARDMGAPVQDGAVFQLHSDSEDSWLKWNPSIPATSDGAGEPEPIQRRPEEDNGPDFDQ